jgi:hypothetical protein
MKDILGSLKKLGFCCGLAGTIALAPQASGSSVLLNFDNVFSGVSPSGQAPWVSVLFEDIRPGTVELSISAINLSPSEKVTELYLNLNPNWVATRLNFSFVEGSQCVTAPMPALGVNAFKADGDGKYDIRFSFAQRPANAFTAGDHLTYQITGIDGLTAQDFAYLSMPAGGHGPFFSAIHVQGIEATDVGSKCISGWVSPSEVRIVTVPEPTAGMLVILMAGLVGGGRWFARRGTRD